MEQGLMAQAAPPNGMPAGAPQGPPAEQAQPSEGDSAAGVEQLAERFAQVALDPQFAEMIQKAFDDIPSPVNAVAFLLAQLVQQVEAKLGPIKDEVLFADGGAAQVFVSLVLTMAEEAGLEGAATPEAAGAALTIATTMLATGEAMAELQIEGGGQQAQASPGAPPMPDQAPQQPGGLMA